MNKERFSVRIDHVIVIKSKFNNNTVISTSRSYLKYYNEIAEAIEDYKNKIVTLKDNPEAYCPSAGRCIVQVAIIELVDKEKELHKFKIETSYPGEDKYTDMRQLRLFCEYKSDGKYIVKFNE